jgi:NAD(P)H-binding
MVVTPNKSIDVIGLPAFSKVLAQNNKEKADADASSASATRLKLPKLVMCSSAGVTRTTWSKEKKEKFAGCADIPIVRLNPFGILDRKRESEVKLREISSDYCIVRPCGLNDQWPAGSRPMLSQGDVAVGRLNRKDLATVLVDVLSAPEATGKTFEVVGIAGYPRPLSLRPALARLYQDGQAPNVPPSMADEWLFATYTTMQQLLPGEKQDAAALAMGQTYEQLDQGTTGRLGERGKEDVDSVAPRPSS